MAQQIKKKFIAPDAIDGSKLKLLEGEAVRLQTPAGEVELLKKDAQGKLVSEGDELSFKGDMEAHVESIRSSLQSNIDAEESARIADVDSEESRAMGVESSLQSQISQEVSDRQSEVTRVEGLLSTEESARIAGDLNLQNQIDNVLSNIDPTALDSLTEIIAAFQEADGSLQGAISTLAGNSSGNIEAEQSRAEAAEASLQSQINQEISDRQADVDAEEMRAMEVEGSLQSQLSQEISDRIADVDAEESARIAEDLTLVKLNGSRSMTGNLNMGGGAIGPRTRNAPNFPLTANVLQPGVNLSFILDNGFDKNTEIIKLQKQVGSYGVPGSSVIDIAVWSGGMWSFVDSNEVEVHSEPSSTAAFSFTTTFTGQVNFAVTEQVAAGLKIINLANGTLSTDAANYGQVLSVSSTVSNLQTEVNTTQTGAGLSTTGTYVADFTRNYSQNATSLHNADKFLDTALKTEESARMYEDGVLQSQITQEISDRQADVDAEESRAMGVESSLQSQITQEISDRIADVDAEESRAMGVEGSLQSELDATQLGAGLASDGSYVPESQFNALSMLGVHYIMNATSLHDADKLLDANLKNTYDALNGLINNEFQFRIDGDAAEASARIAAVQSLQSAISSEESSRIAADQSLQSQIDNVLSNLDPAALDSLTEIVAAFQSADSSLQGAISTLAGNSSGNIEAEESRAMAVEASLQSQITQEISDRIADVDAEQSRAEGVEASLQSQITQEISDRIADVDAEESRAMGVESSLQSQISQEISDRQADVDAEESRALAVEGSLQSQISQEISDRMAAVSAEESARIAEDLTFFKKDGSREMTGSIIPSVDVSFDLGSSSKRFRDLYLSGNTIDLGGVTLSNESNEFVVRDSSNNELAIVSDNVREGIVNKFFTESRVQETEMSMLDVTKSGEVVSTDSLIDAVSKLQNQMTQEISDRQDDVDTEESRALAAEGLLDGRLDVLEALAFEKESFTLGVNPTGITLAHSPKAKSTVMFVGRLALHEGLDYSISGNQVTFIGDFAYNSEDEIAAAEGDVVKVTYYY